MSARRRLRSSFMPAVRAILQASLATCLLTGPARVSLAAPPPPGAATTFAGTAAAPVAPGGGDSVPPGPVVFVEGRYGLSLTLAPEDAQVCVLYPNAMTDPVGCAGVDLAAARSGLAGSADKTVGVALLRFEGWTMVVAILQLVGYSGDWTEHSMAEFIDGVRTSMPETMPGGQVHGTPPGSDHDTVDIRGHRAVRFYVDGPTAPDNPGSTIVRQVNYALCAEGAIVMMSFTGDPEHETELRRIAAASMDSLVLRDPAPAPSKAYLWGRFIGTLAMNLVLLGGGVALVILLVRGLTKKRSP